MGTKAYHSIAEYFSIATINHYDQIYGTLQPDFIVNIGIKEW